MARSRAFPSGTVGKPPRRVNPAYIGGGKFKGLRGLSHVNGSDGVCLLRWKNQAFSTGAGKISCSTKLFNQLFANRRIQKRKGGLTRGYHRWRMSVRYRNGARGDIGNDQLARAANVTTHRADRFAERADWMWTRHGSRVIDRAAAVASEHAEEWASSTIMMQLNFSARSHSAGSGAISPSIENTPSVISNYGRASFRSLCNTFAIGNVPVLETLMVALESRPAIDDGRVIQFIGKNQIVFPEDAATVPAFAVKRTGKQRLLGPLELRNLFFERDVQVIVPAIVRTAPAPTPCVRIASIAARRSALCVVRPR